MREYPNYVPAYVAAGTWAEQRYNAYDEAMDWYNQAIKANPKDSVGYVRYAKVLTRLRRPDEAAAKIKEITKYVPDFPVNKEIARIYSNLGQINEAVDFYAHENLDNLDSEDLKDYATNLFLKHQYKESLEVAKYGYNKYPKLAPMSRLALYNCVELKEFKEAYRYGNHLFNDTEQHNDTWADQYYMALACQGAGQAGLAIDWFRRCTQADDIAPRERNESYRSIAKLYQELGDYDLASKTYDQLYEVQKAENNISAQDINLHARLFLVQSTEVNGEEVFECYRKANKLY
jgi:tetratricopeptide (TPR) repeat protein